MLSEITHIYLVFPWCLRSKGHKENVEKQTHNFLVRVPDNVFWGQIKQSGIVQFQLDLEENKTVLNSSE